MSVHLIINVKNFLANNKGLTYRWNGKSVEVWEHNRHVGYLVLGKNNKGRFELK